MTKDEALIDLLEAVDLAIYSGDWKVDGACDPDAAIQRARKALAQPEITTGNILMDSYKAMQSMKVEGPRHVVCQCDKCKAQPEQKPMHPQLKAMLEEYFDKCFSESAPQRKPLTNEEIEVLLSEYKPAYAWFQFARAIEAAHGIKGKA